MTSLHPVVNKRTIMSRKGTDPFKNVATDALEMILFMMPFSDIIQAADMSVSISNQTVSISNQEECIKSYDFWTRYFKSNTEEISRAFITIWKEHQRFIELDSENFTVLDRSLISDGILAIPIQRHFKRLISSHPNFDISSFKPEEVHDILLDIAGNSPNIVRNTMMVDIDRSDWLQQKLIDIVIEKQEYLVYDHDFNLKHLVLLLVTNGHTSMFMYLIQTYRHERNDSQLLMSVIEDISSNVFDSFTRELDHDYDFVDYLRVMNLQPDTLLLQKHSISTIDILDKVADDIQRVCQSEMESDFYSPIVENIIDETVDYLERSDFDIHDVAWVVQKAISSFGDSTMGSSYLTGRMEKYL